MGFVQQPAVERKSWYCLAEPHPDRPHRVPPEASASGIPGETPLARRAGDHALMRMNPAAASLRRAVRDAWRARCGRGAAGQRTR
jgi:hypothetical protein